MSLAAMLLLQLASAPAADSRYLVALERGLVGTDYARAADELARHRGGAVFAWDGELASLAAELAARTPRSVAFVLAPSSIDANLPRRIVPVLARIDDDPFVDCNDYDCCDVVECGAETMCGMSMSDAGTPVDAG